MRIVREIATPVIFNIARNACAAVLFVIRALNYRYVIDGIATDRQQLKADCADSESRFLAIKKFSWLRASGRIVDRQNGFLARIGATDSRRDFSIETMHRRSC
jgi:hypothetical protein